MIIDKLLEYHEERYNCWETELRALRFFFCNLDNSDTRQMEGIFLYAVQHSTFKIESTRFIQNFAHNNVKSEMSNLIKH